MKKLLLLIVVTMATAIASAQIIHVPGDYGTIQEGIDAAQFWGDTVLVAEGTYYENIDFNGKFITLASEFAIDGDTNHINNTIINGSQPANPNYGSVVYLHSGEDTNSVICGFTITGGTGIYVSFLDMYGGGGIGIENNSGAKIIHNYIEYNTIVSNGSGSGGGIGAGDKDNTNYVVIRNNRVCNNSVIADENSEGGGMTIFCNAIIKDNIVCNNLVTAETKTAVGGGIRLIGYETERYIECTGNLIANNEVYSNSSSEYAGAGGLQVFRCYGNVSNNLIKDNLADGALGVIGGAILNAFSASDLIFEKNIIQGNTANFDNIGGKGGGLYIVDANPVLVNNIVCYNYASLGGGIYHLLNYDNPTQLINNTIAFNQDGDDGGAIYLEDADMVVMNTILWNNDTYEGNEIAMTGNSNIEVAYSDVSGGWPGVNIIDDDPVFDDDSCHLSCSGSHPCIDAGTAQFNFGSVTCYAPQLDFEGDERPLDVTYDIGADESLICDGIEELHPVAFDLSGVNPNPSDGRVLVRYHTDEPIIISLTLLNLHGSVVFAETYNKPVTGEHSEHIDLSFLPDGCYLLRLQAGDVAETEKIIIQK